LEAFRKYFSTLWALAQNIIVFECVLEPEKRSVCLTYLTLLIRISMYIYHVYVHVKKDYVEDFMEATIENAKNSLLEPGIARFDIVQQQDDPTRFVLVEAYRTYEDPARHKATEHYQRWREAVADMMEEPRSSTLFFNIFPEEESWD
jgi:autoinducer 2-degrading protein